MVTCALGSISVRKDKHAPSYSALYNGQDGLSETNRKALNKGKNIVLHCASTRYKSTDEHK